MDVLSGSGGRVGGGLIPRSACREGHGKADGLTDIFRSWNMIIDRETCIGCGDCVFTCTVDAIRLKEDKAEIDREACVECGNCLRVAGCPTGALQQDELACPRAVRKYFSDNQWGGIYYSTVNYGSMVGLPELR